MSIDSTDKTTRGQLITAEFALGRVLRQADPSSSRQSNNLELADLLKQPGALLLASTLWDNLRQLREDTKVR